ncbi:MAG: CZB domain-containing protein [Woeseiaceae bacterium]
MNFAATKQTSLEEETDELTVFTFWIADELFAVDIANILSITQDIDNLMKTPVKSKGLTGIINYLGNPVAVYNFAEMLNIRSSREQNAELSDLLNAREKDHIDWIDALEKSLKKDVSFEKARDPLLCAFGKWYDKFETRDEALAEIMTHFDEPHKKIHALADELLDLKENGKLDQALEKLQLARITTLSYLRKHFSNARAQIEDSMHTVVINITNDGTKAVVALLIDEIHEVMDFKQEDLIGLEAIGLDAIPGMDGFFKGYLGGDSNKTSCLLLDTKNLLNNIKEIN